MGFQGKGSRLCPDVYRCVQVCIQGVHTSSPAWWEKRDTGSQSGNVWRAQPPD